MIGPDSIHNYNDIRQLVEIIMYIIYIIIHLFASFIPEVFKGKNKEGSRYKLVSGKGVSCYGKYNYLQCGKDE